ncbi:hypothetical protein O181_079085 [Austropuccinia psidii MF-1]|uniref:Uncharacterized protein n=1 Tax=Austropuccinia psidii MF-1 TaxID=1389203 RepID=A0A9Q3FE43_9BASI|nr:hypothetical protein [Austropuccinia psidii MF-1]
MTIIYKERKNQTNADGLSRWPPDNLKRNTSYDPEVSAKMTIHIIEIDRKRNFKFSEWAPGSGTLDTDHIGKEEKQTPILRIHTSELHKEFFNQVKKYHAKNKQCSILMSLWQHNFRSSELEYQLEEPWVRDYNKKMFSYRWITSSHG